MNGFELTRRQLAEVDPTAALNAIAEIRSRRRECQDAIDEGLHRLGGLGRKIAEARQGNIANPSDAADAMMDGRAIPISSVADIEAERQAVQIGLRELREREAVMGAEESQSRSDASQLLVQASMPALEPLKDMARQGAELIMAAYAGAQALAQGTANSAALTFAHALSEMVAEAVSERLAVRKPIEVPKPVIDALSTGSKAIGQLGRKIPTTVPVPDHKLNAPLIGLVASALG
jgi:hypothetical protein